MQMYEILLPFTAMNVVPLKHPLSDVIGGNFAYLTLWSQQDSASCLQKKVQFSSKYT